LSGLLSNNLGAIGHSEVCHPIQDRALEYQFFELIINLAGLQPIADDRLEAKDLSLRPNSADDSCSLASTLYARLFGCAVNSRLAHGAVSADLFDLYGYVLKQIRQDFGVADTLRSGHDAGDFERRVIHAEV
jgi:hypothetical protein